MPTGFETLTSTSNEKVRFLRALSDAKTRRESGLMRAEGRNLCYEAAACPSIRSSAMRRSGMTMRS